jgi:molybdopterin-containing oxidoreductase family iron-sulfur binding subunit
MHWMRIDRYFSGYGVTRSGKVTVPNDPVMVMQPVTCMHCENAPCETVCPVNATVHNEEGLNVMAYNRCIGTRYCANNCPYKVRRFNYFDYNERQVLGTTRSGLLSWIMGVEKDMLYAGPLGPKGAEETIKMQKNPNVTVRMRGVIEKCTFCVQRLEAAKIEHKIKNREGDIKIPTDSVRTACQDACPADAIVFGDQSDAESRVAKIKAENGLNYNLLDYLNVRPRLSYLARIRNPNPLMPGAAEVGMGLVNELLHHGGNGKEHHKSADAPAHGKPEGKTGGANGHGH